MLYGDYMSTYETENVMKKYIVNRNHVHEQKACDIAMVLFDTLVFEKVACLEHGDRELLAAAAKLHDIGYFINKEDHHRHSFYILNHEKLLDRLPAQMRNELSIICLNHRKNNPIEYCNVNPMRRNPIVALISLLRLADVLSDRQIRHVGTRLTGDKEQQNLFIDIEMDTCDLTCNESQQKTKLMSKIAQKSILADEQFGVCLFINQLPTIFELGNPDSIISTSSH